MRSAEPGVLFRSSEAPGAEQVDLIELQTASSGLQQRLLAFVPVVGQRPILSWNRVL